MGRFTTISQDAFNNLQLDAGVLLNTFNPASPTAPTDTSIICATTGGITVNCTPTFSDFAEDVDNAPNNVKEFKHLDGWECTMEFTALGVKESFLKIALGCADSANKKVTPRSELKQADFTDIWWVGDRADGGAVAVKLSNALSTGGISLQTTKNGKGQISVTMTGHVSLANPDVVPMEFYEIAPAK